MKYAVIIFLLISANAVKAQETASGILLRFTNAVGGKNNIAAVSSIYAKADCQGPNGKYQTEIQSAADTLTIFRQVREGKPDYTGIINGSTYWTKDTVPVAASNEEAFAWRSHELQWMAIHLNSFFHHPVYAGNENFGGKKTNKLTATDALGNEAQLFFDNSTSLLLGFIIHSPGGDADETIRLEIKEWKKVGNLLLPKRVVFTDNKGDFSLHFHTIRLNSVDQKVFAIPPPIRARKELLILHELQRTAHFNRDARLLVSIMADDFLSISNGNLSRPKKEDLLKRFQSYFDSVTFIEWDDITAPVIKLSADATMANMFVTKRIVLKNKDGKEETTIFAWTSTFQHTGGRWQMTAITSTRENQ